MTDKPVDVIAMDGNVVIRRDGREVIVHRGYMGASTQTVALAVAAALEEFGIPATARVRFV